MAKGRGVHIEADEQVTRLSLDKIHQHGKEPMHRAGGLAFLIAHSGHGIIGSEHERISVNCDKLHISDLSDIIQ